VIVSVRQPNDFAVLLRTTLVIRSASCKARAPDPAAYRVSSNCLLDSRGAINGDALGSQAPLSLQELQNGQDDPIW
jgi:hypothetical protein